MKGENRKLLTADVFFFFDEYLKKAIHPIDPT